MELLGHDVLREFGLITFAAQVGEVKAVSYTHLDVYKRQQLEQPLHRGRQFAGDELAAGKGGHGRPGANALF